jgi:hypothetical protein
MLRAVLLLSLFSAAFARDCNTGEMSEIDYCHSYQKVFGVVLCPGCNAYCETSYACEYTLSTCTYGMMNYYSGSCPSSAVDTAFKFAGAVLIGTIGAGLQCRRQMPN